jgi:thioredoxin reductase
VSARRLAVVGAGPIGLAAALGAVRRGLDVTVLERDVPGAALRRWGPTRFFSPLSMNLPPGAAEVVGAALPPGDALLTGPELADHVLAPLAASAPLAGRVLAGHRVVAVGRAGMSRGAFPGHPVRGERAFRLLVETPAGERVFEADAVVDASGVYGQPNALGAGGLPAVGERAAAGRILRDLGALDAARGALAGRRVLVVGNGHSAAHAVGVLEAVAEGAPGTRVTWASRAPNQRPCVEVASDPLPERQRVVAHANDRAARPPAWLAVERRAQVEAIAVDTDGALRVSLSGGRAVVDTIVSLTGYRPDLSFLSELALDIAPATEGAGRLARALAGVTDCLSAPAVLPADLASGEPRLYLAGAKSYGRASTFLLRAGYAQVETILDALAAGAR